MAGRASTFTIHKLEGRALKHTRYIHKYSQPLEGWKEIPIMGLLEVVTYTKRT